MKTLIQTIMVLGIFMSLSVNMYSQDSNKHVYLKDSKELKKNTNIQTDLKYQVIEETIYLKSLFPEADTLIKQNFFKEKIVNTQVKKVTYRLDPDEISKLDPNLVDEDVFGNKKVDYTSLIIFLLAELQEQNILIEELQKEINTIK